MKESEIRRRLAEVEKQLAEEKAARERAEQTIADLAKAAADRTAPPHPCPVPCPVPPCPSPTPLRIPPGVYAYAGPFRDPADALPPFFVAYAVSFPSADRTSLGAAGITTLTSTPPPDAKK